MAGVATTAPGPSILGYPGIFTLLKSGSNTTPQERLERLATFPLGGRPQLVVCLEAPEPHIRMLWENQFVTPSFAQNTPENRNVLNFAQDIRIGLLPATVVVHLEWLSPE